MDQDLSRRATLGLGGAAAMSLLVPSSAAADEVLPRPEWGSIGLAAGQVARLSVVNHDHAGPGDLTPCIMEIRTQDNRLLVSKQVDRLGPGEGTYVDFAHPGRIRGAASRIQVYGVMRHQTADAHHHGSSLEIFDVATGATYGVITPCIFVDNA